MRGIGGSESVSKHIAPERTRPTPEPRRTIGHVTEEESQRDEMNAAIRAQRERGAVPRSMLPPEDELPPRTTPAAASAPPPQPKRNLFGRFFKR